MNATLKSIITNPFVIGGAALGAGVTAGAIIYAKHRPKTDAEVELEKIKEKNAEAEREREHQRELERIKARQASEEVEALERTKREAKAQEERTKQIDKELTKIREEREWQKNAPQGYWDLKKAEAEAAGKKAASNAEYEAQREIAKLQAEAAKYSADAQARAAKDREYFSYKRLESANNADAAKTQALYGGIANIVSGVTGHNN